jgi:Domain of unknown function (DUF4167)
MNMQKRSNNGGGKMHRGGGRRFSGHRNNNNSNRGGANDGQNIARQKHHATQMREKYSGMARDAQMNGDVVDMEYYLQHVDHYMRVLTDIAAIEAERFAAREHHAPQQGNDSESHDIAADSASQDATSATNLGQEGSENRPAQESRERQPRRPYNGGRGRYQSSGSAANEPNPNANTTEIPLPESVIPQIQ